MKIASIDIGTNSMRLLIADYDQKLLNRKKYINTTRMGQGVNSSGVISEEAIERNVSSFVDFVNTAKKENAEYIYAIGTSALRDSKNKEEFIDKAKSQTGVDIEIINGNVEAELGFYGATLGIKDKHRVLIIDIGGGSTEFVIGSKDEGVIFRESVDIGAVRLTESFQITDTDTDKNLNKMSKHINKKINHLSDIVNRHNIKSVIGIGGTITTTSSINQNMQVYDTNKIHNSTIKREDVRYILDALKIMKTSERKKVIGLEPSRADIILAGLNIFYNVLDNFEIDKIKVSEYDNLEGLIFYKLSVLKGK